MSLPVFLSSRRERQRDRNRVTGLQGLLPSGTLHVSSRGAVSVERLTARRKSGCIRRAMHPRSTPTRLPRWGPRPGGVAPRSNTPGILGRRALPSGRLARLGATPDFHHGLLSAVTRGQTRNRDLV